MVKTFEVMLPSANLEDPILKGIQTICIMNQNSFVYDIQCKVTEYLLLYAIIN